MILFVNESGLFALRFASRRCISAGITLWALLVLRHEAQSNHRIVEGSAVQKGVGIVQRGPVAVLRLGILVQIIAVNVPKKGGVDSEVETANVGLRRSRGRTGVLGSACVHSEQY